MRLAPLTALIGSLIDFGASQDYVSPSASSVGTAGFTGIAPGTIIQAAPSMGVITTTSVPNWGACEVMYVLNTSSSTFLPGRIVQIDKNFAILDAPNTANTGKQVYVALSNFSAGNVTTQGGWVLRRGICPVSYSVAATAGPLYIGAAGQATPTAAAGKQILNASCLIAASGNFTRSVTTKNGSSQVKLSNIAGVFVGQAISGTGIPASSVVSSIADDGSFVVIGSAVGTPVAATATGTVTGTFTHTGFGIVHIDNPFVQGQIT